MGPETGAIEAPGSSNCLSVCHVTGPTHSRIITALFVPILEWRNSGTDTSPVYGVLQSHPAVT